MVRTFTATDDCGNSTSATQTIASRTRLLRNSRSCGLLRNALTSLSWTQPQLNNCGEVTIESEHGAITSVTTTITRTFTATDDASNNVSYADHHFRTLLLRIRESCRLRPSALIVILNDAMASDNCGTVSIEVSSTTIDDAGATTVVRVRDGRRWQQHWQPQTIRVQTTTAPELTIPADYTAGALTNSSWMRPLRLNRLW